MRGWDEDEAEFDVKLACLFGVVWGGGGGHQPDLNTCMKNINRGREHVEDAGCLSFSLRSPAVQSSPIQAKITDTLRSKQTTETHRNSLKPRLLNPLCSGELR